MLNQVYNKLVLTDREKELFNKLKEDYSISDKLFYKDNMLYSIKIIYKNNNIIYQLKGHKTIKLLYSLQFIKRFISCKVYNSTLERRKLL